MSNVWVYIDAFQGQARPESWEALNAGKSVAAALGGPLTALVFGCGAQDIAQKAIHYGADAVLQADDPALEPYILENYAATLAQLAAQRAPAVILFPNTARSRDLAAAAAVDLDSGILPDAAALEVADGAVIVTRQLLGGRVLSKASIHGRPQIITVRARSFGMPTPDPNRSGEIIPVATAAAETRVRVTGFAPAEARVDVTQANVIVSGGRGLTSFPATPPPGLKDKEAEKWRTQQGFKLLQELADLLGGVVGASRAVVDSGYMPYEYQIGQTGKMVSPNLYIACGISGAIQHTMGIANSKVIVAINKDANAPIFKMARYGVVGDVNVIVPALIQAFKERMGSNG